MSDPLHQNRIVSQSDSSSVSHSSEDSIDIIDEQHIAIDVGDVIELDTDFVHKEDELVQYTQDHKGLKLDPPPLIPLDRVMSNATLDSERIDEYFARCDSPITGSNYGSYYGSNPGSSNNSDIDEREEQGVIKKTISLSDIASGTVEMVQTIHSRRKPSRSSQYRQLAYQDVERGMDKYYDTEDIDSKYSSEIDILTTYMKGQKNVYVQAKQFSQMRLHSLMIPSLIITSLITVISHHWMR